jgi:two-component system alkaline phosphatase synthesis response regulator PhoP
VPDLPKLLVVEDDPDIAAALVKYAEHRGYRPFATDNGLKAVELAKTERPEVILLDIALPGLDGRDVMVQLKASGVTNHAVVIFVTARDGQSDRLLGLELGADDYEGKPLVFATLFNKIEKLRRNKLGADG